MTSSSKGNEPGFSRQASITYRELCELPAEEIKPADVMQNGALKSRLQVLLDKNILPLEEQ